MRLQRRATAAFLALGAAATVQSAPAAGADAIPCDQTCQAAWDHQWSNALPRTAFYDAPDPLSPAPAGTLIRQQDTSEYQVEGRQVTATRILYHSRTSDDRDVAVSGVVLVPPGSPPAGGWPTVVDAHGTSGIGRDCAPSLMRDLYHGNQMLRFVEHGYAVVAPDYAGMGTDGRVEYINKTAEASDVISAARAARQTGLGLSAEWVLWGHSQGGGAALGVAERQAVTAEPGYLGTVVTSPAADVAAAIAYIARTPGLGGFIPEIANGARNSDPTIPLGRLLTGPALERMSVLDTACQQVIGAVYQDLSGDDLVRPDFMSEPHFAGYLARNTLGRQPVGGPVLVLQGDADFIITREHTDGVVASLCALGAELEYRTYPGLGHDTYPGIGPGIDDGAMPDILAWTADRFAGRPAASTCS